MTSFWKIAAPVTCVAVICGAALLWPVYQEEALERKPAEAARVYRARAERGEAKAQYRLGDSYAQGKGVPQDYFEAVRWYRKAAKQGNANAEYALGYMYHQGQGVKQDDAEAVRWFRQAAEQGNAQAQCNLGDSYAQGHGVPQDYAEAVRWYRAAAEQGYPMGQYGIGFMYYHGRGVPQDYIQAHMWTSLAASGASGDAKQYFVRAANHIAGEMTPEQIIEAERLAREWKPRGQPSARSEHDSQR